MSLQDVGLPVMDLPAVISPHGGALNWGCCRVWRDLPCHSSSQCTLPILAKCGGHYEKYLNTW